MELASLEKWKQQSIQEVIMQEKMVEQAKAKVAHIEGRITERREMFAEAEQKKTKLTKKATDKIAEDIAKKAKTKPSTKK